MSIVVSLATVIAALLGHTVFWTSIVNRSHAYSLPRWIVDLSTLVCGVGLLLLVWPVVQFSVDRFATAALEWMPRMPDSIATWYGWFCVVFFVASGAHKIWLQVHPEKNGGLRSERVEPISLGDLSPRELLVPGVVRTLGTLPGNQTLRPVVGHKELEIAKLPDAFDGFRIAHLSDLHLSGRIAREFLDLLVDQTNALEPDLTVITGDIIERAECLDWVNQSLARLESKYPKMFVLGNHDNRVGAEPIRERMEQAGFVNMAARWQRFDTDRGPMLVAGNEEPWFPPAADLTDFPTGNDGLRLALVHTPDLIWWGRDQGFHLLLAGHNHGGQIRLPGLGALVAPSKHGTRYASGVFRQGGTVMHVSRGTSSLSPVRWNCPPEIALLTLRSV